LNRKVRIFYLIGTLDVGGAEGQLVRLLEGLDRNRFHVTVCCLSSSAGPYADEVRRLGIEVHEIGFRGLRTAPYPHKVFGEFLRLVRLIRRERPDIVHAYLFWAYVLGTFAARFARVPKVISSRRSLGNFKAGKPLYLLLERASNAMTSVIIANSIAVRDDAIRQERLDPNKIIVIYNGVDTAKFATTAPTELAEELHLEGKTPIITVLANFIRYKGHGFFFDAWKRVVAMHPSAVAVLIGEGPDRKEWQQWVESQGLDSSVRFAGSRRDVPAILALTDIVAHPSLEEGFSNAILESMAAGRPVVATAVGGNPEAIENGKTGLLVPVGDVDALVSAISALASEPQRAREMGESGRTRAALRFSVERMIRAYENVYESVAAGQALQADSAGLRA
jgi:glycosyltransferase involved in cell wall biosynthesis